MPYFEITPEHADTIADATARIRAIRPELQDLIRGLVAEAAEEGRRVAEMEAPRGEKRFHEGSTIRDAIRVREIRYAPGGAGGGGFYEADFYVSSFMAPQIRYVMEGTADDGRGLIRPARGNVLAIQVNGGEKYRAWAHGQRPQTEWWNRARDAARHHLEAGMDSIR